MVQTKALEWRKRAGLSQVQVAGRVGITVRRLVDLEAGRLDNLRYGLIVQVAHWWGASVADLIPSAAMRPRSRGDAPVT